MLVEGNVAVGLLGFNLVGILIVVDDKFRTLLPHPVCINRLVVNLPAPSSHVFSYASRSRTTSPRPPLPPASCPPTAPFSSPSHVATWTRSLSFREGKGAGCDRWKDGEDHVGQTAAEGPTEAYAEAVWDVEWTACAEDSVGPKKGGWCAIRGRRSTLQVVTLRRLE